MPTITLFGGLFGLIAKATQFLSTLSGQNARLVSRVKSTLGCGIPCMCRHFYTRICMEDIIALYLPLWPWTQPSLSMQLLAQTALKVYHTGQRQAGTLQREGGRRRIRVCVSNGVNVYVCSCAYDDCYHYQSWLI